MAEIFAPTPAMLPSTWHVMGEVPDDSDYINAMYRQAASSVSAGSPVGLVWETRTYRSACPRRWLVVR